MEWVNILLEPLLLLRIEILDRMPPPPPLPPPPIKMEKKKNSPLDKFIDAYDQILEFFSSKIQKSPLQTTGQTSFMTGPNVKIVLESFFFGIETGLSVCVVNYSKPALYQF